MLQRRRSAGDGKDGKFSIGASILVQDFLACFFDHEHGQKFGHHLFFGTKKCHCEMDLDQHFGICGVQGVTLIALLTLVVCNLAGRALNCQGFKDDFEL